MIPKSPFNNRVWNYLSSTLQEFKVMLLGYRSYKVLLTQTGTNPPVATLLENTLISNPTWTYVNQGNYELDSVENFVGSKTTVVCGALKFDMLTYSTPASNKVSIITIGTSPFGPALPLPNDDLLSNTLLEIRTYL